MDPEPVDFALMTDEEIVEGVDARARRPPSSSYPLGDSRTNS
jgi:hypothetical protein